MASHASHGWEAVNNHMWPDKPVRQAREPSEELVDLNTLVTLRSFINWSSKLTLFQREVVGIALHNIRSIGESIMQ